MDSISIPGDDMARRVKARFIQGTIQPLEKLDLEEGEEIIILVKYNSSLAPKLRFGMLPGAVIKGDIVSPLDDVEWDALR